VSQVSSEEGPASLATLSGSCHCGAVRLEVAHRPPSLTECNCSICARYGARWGYFTRDTARVHFPPGRVTAYLWGDREIEFYHCNTCGCLTHYESIEKNPASRIGVNARMFAPADFAGVPVRKFDGASTWKYLDEQ
jgi:hypothetical protein